MAESGTTKKKSSVHMKVDSPQVADLYEEIEKVKAQIDELLLTSNPNDPEVKANVKKMKQIKKYLAKKTANSRNHSFLSFRRKRKQDIKNVLSLMEDDIDALSVTSSEIELGECSTRPNIACADIDDSIIYGVECILSIWNEIQQHMHKTL